MSKKDEALKLALEALERMKGYGNVFLHHRHTQNPYEQVCEAITALREALAEQPAQRTWVGLTEQEAAECWSTSTVRTWQAIEAKLKEKNT